MTEHSSPKNPLALIIENDEKLAHIFSEALQMAGFEIEIIQDGQTASRRLAEIKPAVVTLELHLPRLSGTDILYQIRASERLAETRVIITTADPAIAEIIRPDADLVLIKPISFIQLRDLAARLRPPDIVTLG